MSQNDNTAVETQPKTATTAPTPEMTANAQKIATRYMWYCAGVGLVPIPIIDFVGITALQIKLVHDLAKNYKQDFNKEIARSIISTMVAGVTTGGLASGTSYLLRQIPLIGGILGFTTISLYSMGTTYAIGKVFTQHFESGGTLLTFNPEKLKAYFSSMYAEGRDVANDMLKNKKNAPAGTTGG